MKPWEYREEVHGRAYQPPPSQASDNKAYHPLQTEDPQTMLPDIRAAYDRGEFVIFSKKRGRWELYQDGVSNV